MSTYMEKAGIERKWYIIDATGKPLAAPPKELLSSCAAKISPPLPLMLTAAIMSSSSMQPRLF